MAASRSKRLVSFLFLSLIFTFPAQAQNFFGFQGYDGRNGNSGRSGHNGQDVTVFAQQGSQAFNLTGGNGSPGNDGSDGSSASSCYQRLEHFDMQGARGGDGGEGGDGGHGGNGGDVTLYYSSLNQVRGIYIDATGGQGAPGGQGTNGGYPCYCSQHFWTYTYTETRYRDETYQDCSIRRICRDEGTPPRTICEDQRVCETRTRRVPYTYTYHRDYRCYDGRMGRHGMNGNYGRTGEVGQLTLIQSDRPLAPVKPSLHVSLSELEGSYQLSNNRWSTRSGANGLLAPGSRVRDSYRNWDGRIDHQVNLVWAVPGKDPADFGQGTISLELVGERIVATFPDHFLHLKEVQTSEGVTNITITQAIDAADVKKIKAKNFEGTLRDTGLIIEDEAQVSDLVSTRFFIKAKWRKASDGKFYNQWVPAEFIEQDGHTFRINVGQFELKARRFLFFKRKEYFKAGATVKLELIVERSFAGRTITLPVMKLKQKKLGKNRSGLEVSL